MTEITDRYGAISPPTPEEIAEGRLRQRARPGRAHAPPHGACLARVGGAPEQGRGVSPEDDDDSEDGPADWYGGASSLWGWWADTHADDPCEFLLGTHVVSWAWNGRAGGPLFLSQRKLQGRKSRFPPATVPVYIDSGGFTELSTFGRWTVPARSYVDLVRRVSDEMGTVRWAAIQDWMCEDEIRAKTGLTVAEHQRRTVASYHELLALAPEVRWLPVLQGQTLDDYEQHLVMYAESGVHLPSHRLVGVGSVCRRNDTDEIGEVLAGLCGRGLRLHGFGVKADGLRKHGQWLRSADSMAWSSRGRHESAQHYTPEGQETLFDMGPRAKGLQNSQPYAEAWRLRMITDAALGSRWTPRQSSVFAQASLDL